MRFSDGWYVGTGFLIAADLLLTNHHNLFQDTGARLSQLEVRFDYEATLAGAMRDSVIATPDLASIVADRDGDWGVVRLSEPVTGRMPLRFAGDRTKVDAWVAIIQHPEGLPKKIALHHNTVTYVDDQVVHYLTDTLGGSSGSPVFNEKWEVVALHHAGGNVPLPGTKTAVYRNEGIPIAKVKARLDTLGIRYGQQAATSGAP
jgi:V8-like Glu-specific endopeptidase